MPACSASSYRAAQKRLPARGAEHARFARSTRSAERRCRSSFQRNIDRTPSNAYSAFSSLLVASTGPREPNETEARRNQSGGEERGILPRRIVVSAFVETMLRAPYSWHTFCHPFTVNCPFKATFCRVVHRYVCIENEREKERGWGRGRASERTGERETGRRGWGGQRG